MTTQDESKHKFYDPKLYTQKNAQILYTVL